MNLYCRLCWYLQLCLTKFWRWQINSWPTLFEFWSNVMSWPWRWTNHHLPISLFSYYSRLIWCSHSNHVYGNQISYEYSYPLGPTAMLIAYPALVMYLWPWISHLLRFLFWLFTSVCHLQGIKQFFVAVEREEWKFDTLCDLYDTLTITQAVIFCNTKRKVFLWLLWLLPTLFSWKWLYKLACLTCSFLCARIIEHHCRYTVTRCTGYLEGEKCLGLESV